MVADKLEEHLDLKEQALSEIEKLQQTIKCTKLALRRINSSRASQIRIDTGGEQKQNMRLGSDNSINVYTLSDNDKITTAKNISQQSYLMAGMATDPIYNFHLMASIR